MNFTALKIISKIHKKTDPGLTLTQGNLPVEKTEIPAIVNEKIVTKCFNFTLEWGYLASNSSEVQTDLHEFYDLSSSTDKLSFKCNSMSQGLVLLEMFTRTRTPTQMLPSDSIMSADCGYISLDLAKSPLNLGLDKDKRL